ncbi:HoxN/HupN/NixA family nickel/cobalt transporter [Fangia hongkongensis]|uniref:HoxN/HupN/NixA family nickel/cobalt transporter n=1 Tax=Fangia hongkongensis TaxID=270495 RepID=UPI000368BA12|nr:hypothetical protein [Fangia hongkongensis]MBK2125209.1 metal transporter [Fangia hongkongensis]
MKRSYFIKLAAVVMILWCLLLSLFANESALLGMILIAFLLGIRHGFDVDHIIAIDNVTRQLIDTNKASPNVGLFFALGHSSIVFALTLLIVLGVTLAESIGSGMIETGALVGSIVSIVFLWLTGVLNAITLSKFKYNKSAGHSQSALFLLTKPIFKLINRPFKMYFVGFLFGLGFDTATEIALLSMAAVGLLSGESIWLILSLPVAFASGMVIIDTLDAALVMKLWSTANYADTFKKRINFCILLIVTIFSFVIGLLELLDILEVQVMQFLANGLNNYSSWIGGCLVILCMVAFFLYHNRRRALVYPKKDAQIE